MQYLYACTFRTLTMSSNFNHIFSLLLLCFDRMRQLVNATSRQHTAILLACIFWHQWHWPHPNDLFEKSHKTKLTAISAIVDMVCKPIGVKHAKFTVGYAIPAIDILFCLCRWKMFVRRYNAAMIVTSKECSSNMDIASQQITRVFNLTDLLFMIVWTPFVYLYSHHTRSLLQPAGPHQSQSRELLSPLHDPRSRQRQAHHLPLLSFPFLGRLLRVAVEVVEEVELRTMPGALKLNA